MSNIPDDLLYTDDDEWIRVDGDEALIGVTDYAQDALSDIVFVELLPEVGNTYSAKEAFGVVESVKAAADLYMPVSGEVLAVNDEIQDVPETLNSDPYGEGWLLKIRLTDSDELESLMQPAAYSDYCDERG